MNLETGKNNVFAKEWRGRKLNFHVLQIVLRIKIEGRIIKLDISPRAIHQCSAEGKSDITEKINGKYAVSNETP